MNIILVSGDLGKARTLTLSGAQAVLLVAGALLAAFLAAAGIQYLVLRHAAELNSPYLRSLVSLVQEQEREKTQSYLRDNLNAMAVKLGQMQAQLLRLDTMGDRVARLVGIKPQEFLFDQAPGRGGGAPALPTLELGLGDLRRQLDDLARMVDDRSDKLGVLESVVLQDRLHKKMLPSVAPVENSWYSSNFGWRIDPFTGRNAFHEGVDFMAETGTAIVAAAGGVVVFSDHHPEYGNMIDIDHGNDLVTRYAHASRRLVKVGEVVLRGQKVAEVGNTGRSTGTHLHFEIRHKGVPQNPARFLQARK